MALQFGNSYKVQFKFIYFFPSWENEQSFVAILASTMIWSHLVSMTVIAMAIGFGAFGNIEINTCRNYHWRISKPL